MAKVTFFSGQQLPLEMHKVRIIQKLTPVSYTHLDVYKRQML